MDNQSNNSFGDWLIKKFELPQTVTSEYFDSLTPFTTESNWQLCYRDLNSYDCRFESPEKLSRLCFNTQTRFPDDLKDIAEKVMRDGKRHLLGNTYFTGKNIKVAVIDKPINKDHIEFKDRIEYINVIPDDPDNDETFFHGMTCASYLSGATCGVLPESELVFFAVPNRTSDLKLYYEFQLEALRRIIQYNKESSSPIRVVNLSAPFLPEQTEERNSLASELEKTGCYLIDAMIFNRHFQGIDCDRFSVTFSYSLCSWQIENYENNKNRPGFAEHFSSLCFVPSTRRTAASDDTNDSYIHRSKTVSASWTIPHVAGMFAMCLQKKPGLTLNEFITVCKSCPKIDGRIIMNAEYIIKSLV